jgi:hypothetical protein
MPLKAVRKGKMKSNKGFGILVLLLVVVPLAPDAYALPGDGVLSGWGPNSVSFDYSYEGRTLAGRIDYAVYEDYPGNSPFQAQYLYAYQIMNSDFSYVGVDSLSIAILEGAGVGNIGSDSSLTPDGVEPSLQYFSPSPQAPQSAIYLFVPSLNGLVESGCSSAVLLFGSDNAPAEGFGIIEGGSIGKIVEGLPTPLPEPVTIFLLGIGGAVITLTQKRGTR